jgi:hypothetical protein
MNYCWVRLVRSRPPSRGPTHYPFSIGLSLTHRRISPFHSSNRCFDDASIFTHVSASLATKKCSVGPISCWSRFHGHHSNSRHNCQQMGKQSLSSGVCHHGNDQTRVRVRVRACFNKQVAEFNFEASSLVLHAC